MILEAVFGSPILGILTCEDVDEVPCKRKFKLELGTSELHDDHGEVSTLALPVHLSLLVCFLSLPLGEVPWLLIS